MTRQFRIHLNFLQNFCIYSRSLARSAAHPQLRVLRGLKHDTAWLYVDSSLSCSTHVENTTEKATSRLYLLKQLKRAWVSEKHLLHFYTTVIRPILEYAHHYGIMVSRAHSHSSWKQYKSGQYTLYLTFPEECLILLCSLQRTLIPCLTSDIISPETSFLVYLNRHLVYITFSHPQGQIPPPQGSGHKKNIQGSALVRNVIVHI